MKPKALTSAERGRKRDHKRRREMVLLGFRKIVEECREHYLAVKRAHWMIPADGLTLHAAAIHAKRTLAEFEKIVEDDCFEWIIATERLPLGPRHRSLTTREVLALQASRQRRTLEIPYYPPPPSRPWDDAPPGRGYFRLNTGEWVDREGWSPRRWFGPCPSGDPLTISIAGAWDAKRARMRAMLATEDEDYDDGEWTGTAQPATEAIIRTPVASLRSRRSADF